MAEKKLDVVRIKRPKAVLSRDERIQSAEAIRGVLTEVLREMLSHPEKVSVEYVLGDHTTVFEVDIDLSDFGKLIGSQGKHITALRTIALAMSANKGHRSVVSIKDESRFF